LFTANEQGLWYDPSDFLSMFQDAAGTIPVTSVEQPVGLIIDKRNGGVLNPQLVTNSTFDTDTDWTKGTGWTIGSGVATKTAGVTATLSQSETFVAGKTYRIIYTLTRTAGTITLKFTGGTTVSGTARSAAGTYVDFITAASGNNSLTFDVTSTFAGTVDNVYMREVTGNDGYQITSASRPTLKALYNLLIYTQQFDNAIWVKENGTSTSPVVTSNTVIAPDGTSTADTIVFGAIDAAGDYSVVSQVLTLPATQNYTRSVYIKATSAGDIGKNVYFYVTDVTIKDVVTITLTANWQRITKTLSMASGVGKSFTFGTLGSTYGGANQVSVSADVWGYQVIPENDGVGLPTYQRVNTATDYDATGFPPYLSYDGTDDNLTTQPINLSSGDEALIVAGQRKLRDGTSGPLVASFSSVSAPTTGYFILYCPSSANSYRLTQKGSTVVVNAGTGTFATALTDRAGKLAYKNYDAERARQEAAIGNIGNLYGADYQRQLAAAQLGPQMAQADYQDINQLYQVGQAQESYQQAALADAMQRYNFQQNLPAAKLQSFLSAAYGAPMGQQTTQPIYRNQGANVLGGASLGAALGGGPLGAGIGAGAGLLGLLG